MVKSLHANAGDVKRHESDLWVRKIPMEEGMATQSSVLAWRLPRTEEPGGLQSTGSHRVRHGCSDLARTPQQWIGVHLNFPLHPTPTFPPESLRLCLCFCFASGSTSAMFLDSA